ncbi:hypothetical protein ACRALDRAFT_1064526 [Sodiomyces alcalophilus JCM 7366]|uniref:uncharacterized protein n=1 Tax=Sodiomyces alcalophilus JCM 7366 TaxID=591952 RepID=UPI0039B41986
MTRLVSFSPTVIRSNAGLPRQICTNGRNLMQAREPGINSDMWEHISCKETSPNSPLPRRVLPMSTLAYSAPRSLYRCLDS